MSDISVVIPARNAAATLAETLRSVLVAPEVGEVIVIDDGSEDATAALAQGIADPRLRVIAGPAAGIAAALNTGFSAATGAFLARCDADDLFAPGRLARQRAWLDANPAFVAVSGGFATLFPDGTRAADLACEGDARDVTDLLLDGETVTSLCTWLIRADALRRVGGVRTWFRTAEDIDLQFRLAELGRVWHVPEVTYFYRLHGASITHCSSSDETRFFLDQACAFARERRAHGEDRLERGCPPVPPLHGEAPRQPLDPVAQALGHSVGAAWKEFEGGKRGSAARRLHGLLLHMPFSIPLWRHVLTLNAKYVFRGLLRGARLDR